MSLLSDGEGLRSDVVSVFCSVQLASVGCGIVFLCLKGGQFTEDGSFIGQYVPGRPPVSAHSTPQNPSLQGANAGMATYV